MTINSLKFVTNDSTLNMGTFKLTLNSGGILANRNSTINGTGAIGLTSATNELFYYSSSGITTTINAVIGNTTARMSFIKGGSGAVVLGGLNTFTGDTIVNEGIVTIVDERGLGVVSGSSSVILNGGTLRGHSNLVNSGLTSLTIDDAGRSIILGAGDGAMAARDGTTMNITTGVTSQNGGRLLFDGSVGSWGGNVVLTGTLNLAGGVESFGTASATGTMTLNNTVGTGTIGGIRMFTRNLIVQGTNNITGNILVQGGNLDIGGTNTFSGTMTLDSGITTLQSSTALTTAVPSKGFDLTMTGGARLDTNGYNLTISSLTSGSISTTITGGAASAAPSSLTVNQASFTTYSGRILKNTGSTGTFGLIKQGSGNLTLTAIDSTYTGPTRIEGGTINVVRLANAGSASSLGAGSTLVLSPVNPADLVLAGGALRYIGNAAQGQFGGTNRTFTLGVGADAGALIADGIGRGSIFQMGRGNATANNTIAFEGSGARSLTLGGSNRGDNIFNLILGDGTGGATSLRKIGTGNWILGDPVFTGTNQANTYTGITEVLSGSLVAMMDGAFGFGKVIVSGGTGGQSAPNWINATVELRDVQYNRVQELNLNGGTLAARGNSSWAGSVAVGANSNLFVAAGGVLNLKGTLGGAGSLTQYGDGMVILSGGLTTYRDSLGPSNDAAVYTVVSGTLVLNYGGAYGTGVDGSKLSNTAALVLGGSRFGGALILSGERGSDNVEIVKSLTLNAGENKIIRDTTGVNNAIIRLNTITRNSGATIDFSDEGIASTDNGLTNGILGPWALISGTDWATKSTTQYDTPGGTGTNDLLIVRYTGYTINDDVNAWVATGNMDVQKDNTQAVNASAYTLRFNTPDGGDDMMTIILSGASNLSSGGGILVTSNMGNSAAVISGGSLTTSAADFLIYQNNPDAPLIISSVLTGGVGIDKLGPGELLLYGQNNYTGVTLINEGVTGIRSFGDVNVASGVGSASNAIDRLVFNGGTLQLNGAGGVSTSGRGYTVNNLAVWDIGNENTTLVLNGQYATGGTEADYIVKKVGAGILQLSGTRNTGYGITEWQIADGTVRWVTGNTDNKFAHSEDGKLTMMGGTLEVLGGGTDATRSQFLQGQFTVGTGASTLVVRSTTNQTAQLVLQRESNPVEVVWQRGSSIRFVEDNQGGGFPRIILNGITGVDQQVLLPRALYYDPNENQDAGINFFAFVNANGAANNSVEDFDGHINDSPNVSNWSLRLRTETMHFSDGESASEGFFGAITTLDTPIDTLRFFNNQDLDSVIQIDAGAGLILRQGAILQATHSGNTLKKITGDGELTSALGNSQDDTTDLLIHNWNPLRALEIDVAIVDYFVGGKSVNLVHTGNGTTSVSRANTYSGWTYLHGGVLRLDHASALPTTSHVQFHGGVLGLSSNYPLFEWSVGTGNNQVDWVGSGGFAAYGGDQTVNLGG
ncbi:beta strand repeat-containing protein [Verrucomicrobium spinosum]|uniref:beta strand repeat-containing protein n=1 Tax=Verrucomicrobium spinosum TaxID=2736 RepID=UPI000A95E8F0|nr:autotransporter-associated beta strand repeat-containing protein [Verrucomicrobium spinosum]